VATPSAPRVIILRSPILKIGSPNIANVSELDEYIIGNAYPIYCIHSGLKVDGKNNPPKNIVPSIYTIIIDSNIVADDDIETKNKEIAKDIAIAIAIE
jgi:hypothetical protein